LILADALAYASKHLKPTRLVDLATLTGAMLIALGHEVTGMMASDDTLAEDLLKAGEKSGERLCRLPLIPELRADLKSDIADINNVGGREAGSIKAALFLQEFVGDVPWAHLDIAGSAYRPAEKGYLPKHATGVGVRLLMDLLA
ncbi:MAG: aminopeptidase, partial [Chlamydiia bacterium]|nr:aminopeptidase [Chlamydiia bacterium]